MCDISKPHGRATNLAIAVICGVCIVLAVLGSVYYVAKRTESNCDRINHLYVAIDQILVDSNRRIDIGIRRGTVSPTQGKISKDFNNRARLTLKKGYCAN